MKLFNRYIFFLLIILFNVKLMATQWTSIGYPLYCNPAVSYSSTVGWTNNSITVCTCCPLYFRAGYAEGTWDLAPDFDIDVENYENGYGLGIMDTVTYTWDFGDGTSLVPSRQTSHQYVTSTASAYDVTLYVEDGAICYDDPDLSDTLHINVIPVVNPMINTSSGDMDLTHQLPFCGTFTFGTIGWAVSTSGDAQITSNNGNVWLAAQSNGSYSEIHFPVNKSIQIGGVDQQFDQIKVGLSYRTIAPEYELPGKIEVLVYGDTTAFVLPVGMSWEFGEQDVFSSSNFNQDELIQCILSVIPQECSQITDVVIRFTSRGDVYWGDSLNGIILEQVYLGTGRR